MESVKVNMIENTLEDDEISIQDDNNQVIILAPGESIKNPELSIPLYQDVTEIDTSDIRVFEVDGYPATYGFCGISGNVLTSALGTAHEDFAPSDPELVKITLQDLEPGQGIKLHFKKDELSSGNTVTWVLGELDDNL